MYYTTLHTITQHKKAKKLTKFFFAITGVDVVFKLTQLQNSGIVYNQRDRNENIGYIKNTINFKLLEEKMKEWSKNN